MKLISFKGSRAERKSAENGYLSVFLALIMTILLSLCLALVDGARSSGARFMTEYAMDAGMESILAEYHRELLKQYDVLFMDVSYGTALPSLGKTAEHLETYMNRNLSVTDLPASFLSVDLYGLEVQNIRMTGPSVATDDKGKVFRAQAIDYMYDKYGLTLLSQVQEWENVVKEYGLDTSDVAARREVVEGQINALRGKKLQISEEEWVTVEVENPADAVNTQRNKGILLLAMEDPGQVSNTGFDISKGASHRQLYCGVGPVEERTTKDTLPGLLLFDEYLLEKCSYYGQELEKSHMKYQVEYILAGKDNDLDNLKSIALRLLLLREAANVLYLFSDSEKKAVVSAIAEAVSAVILLPELKPLLEASILFAWAFAESVYDVRTLFQNGRIPLLKSKETWHTGLNSVLSGTEQKGDGGIRDGLSYADYLRVFLKLSGKEKKTMRLLDMVELDIRKTPGNADFRIDGCVDGIEITVNVVGKNRDAFEISRSCCYE